MTGVNGEGCPVCGTCGTWGPCDCPAKAFPARVMTTSSASTGVAGVTLEDGLRTTNTIVLEPSAYAALVRFVADPTTRP